MALIDDLIEKIDDLQLRNRIQEEVEKISKQKKFGLVFEEHQPEFVPLYGLNIKKGSIVSYKNNNKGTTFLVKEVNENHALCINRKNKEETRIKISELVSIAEFGEPIYPYLTKVDAIKNAPDSDLWHILIESDNYHALQLLEYIYSRKIDCIYIDPPYNTRDKDWKYNNDYVDKNDTFKHSKWLSMMEKRLKLAKNLLNPDDSVLIITIDEKEVHHLAGLIERIFNDARIQMVSINNNVRAVARTGEFARINEFAFFIQYGKSKPLSLNLSKEWLPQGGNADTVRGKMHWASLSRTDSTGYRENSPGCFYPIYVLENEAKIHSIGDALSLDEDKANSPTAPEGTIAVWPRRNDGREGRWQITPENAKLLLNGGFLKAGPPKNNHAAVYYVKTGDRNKVKSGEYEIIGKDSQGALITRPSDKLAFIPGTVWNIETHDAGVHGTNLTAKFLKGREFPYPKSLYAVRDTLRFFVANKPEAIILDFFAGSGTTANAVNLLNLEDGGKRKSIMITNNEVSDKEAKNLSKKGYKPGDEMWENLGIARFVTWPRLKCSILGKDVENNEVEGEYIIKPSEKILKKRNYHKIDFTTRETLNTAAKKKKFLSFFDPSIMDIKPSMINKNTEYVISIDCKTSILFNDEKADEWLSNLHGMSHISEIYIICEEKLLFKKLQDSAEKILGDFKDYGELHLPMSNGFQANAIFFSLGFLDKNNIALGKQLKELLPILWLKSGANGECPKLDNNDIPDAMIYPENKFAILIKESRFAEFNVAIAQYPEIETVFLITDSYDGYVEMSSLLGNKKTYQLYRDYLDNFRINVRR